MKTYKFSELPEEYREKVIDKFRSVDLDWWEFSYDYIKEQGELLGIQMESSKFFEFSLDRGNYFGFSGRLELADVTRTELFDIDITPYQRLLNFRCADVGVRIDGTEINPYFDLYNGNGADWYNVEQLADRAADYLVGVVERFNWWAIDVLRKEYEWLTSDERIIEIIEANDYSFFVPDSGEIVLH